MSEIKVTRVAAGQDPRVLIPELAEDGVWFVPGSISRCLVTERRDGTLGTSLLVTCDDGRTVVVRLRSEEFNGMVAVVLATLKQAAAEKVGGAS